MSLVNRAWRLAGTGLAFASLGLGGLFLAGTVFPLIAAVTADRDVRIRRTQYVVHASFRLYIVLLRRSGIIDLDLSALADFKACRRRLIVANHPTLLDVVLLMSLNPRIGCIVKHQLWENWFLRGVVRSAGYIRNDLPSEQMIMACSQALASGQNLLVFPEGTRSRPGEARRFQRGFANIAMVTGYSIQLVMITCQPLTLTKGQPWWRIPDRRPIFRVAAMGTVDAKEYLGVGHRAIAARRLVQHVEKCYLDALEGTDD